MFSFISYFGFFKPNKRLMEETFLKSFSTKEFKTKLAKDHPKWMNNQIVNDFNGFAKNKITLNSIDQTFDKITKTIPFQKNYSFIRYRIINNKLYRYYPKNCAITTTKPPFEKAIKTLTKLVKLPDIDLIYSDMDGTPEFYVPKDFYIVNNPQNQAPIFTRAKKINAPYLVLIPDYHSISDKWVKDCMQMLNQMKKYPWKEKDSIAFWRGASSDKAYDVNTYKLRPRVIISKLSQDHPEFLDAGLVITDQVQLKDILLQDKLVKKSATTEEHLKYKYLPVLDGYMCTYPGYQWRLLSNSVCFKQNSDEIQWFYAALKPYVHYIPIENDMSDLLDKIVWAQSSDDICEKIALNATDFVLNNLMLEDNYLYLYKVIDQYSTYLNIDKKQLLKNTLNDSDWICIQQRKKAKHILERKAKES